MDQKTREELKQLQLALQERHPAWSQDKVRWMAIANAEHAGMMKRVILQEKDIDKILNLTKDIENPIFRGLGSYAERNYRKDGFLRPYSGSLSVGTGVFFTNNLEYALDCMDTTLIVTSPELLDPEKKVVDTRIKGYDKKAKERLDERLGEGNYGPFILWEEIQRDDTLTYEGGPKDSYVYTRRTPVTREEIILEIVVESTT